MGARSSLLCLVPVGCAVLLGCGDATPVPAAPPLAAAASAATPAARPFGLYLLALTWAPTFCCTKGKATEECQASAGSYAADHLTLHGLWPNYSDAEQARIHEPYPQFCGSYSACGGQHPAPQCSPDPASIPAAMQTYGPGYLTDRNFLANHEWSKHGSCTSLSAGAYFAAALGTRDVWPGHDWTPDLVRQNVGGALAPATLAAAWRRTAGADAPDGSVLLSCEEDCNLAEVSICFNHDASDAPLQPIVCPKSTAAGGRNTCVTRQCERVKLRKASECG